MLTLCICLSNKKNSASAHTHTHRAKETSRTKITRRWMLETWHESVKRVNKWTNETVILVKYGYFTKSSAHADAFLFVDLINKTNLLKQTMAVTDTKIQVNERNQEREKYKRVTPMAEEYQTRRRIKEENRKKIRLLNCIKAKSDDGTTLWKMWWEIFAESVNSKSKPSVSAQVIEWMVFVFSMEKLNSRNFRQHFIRTLAALMSTTSHLVILIVYLMSSIGCGF